MSDSAGDGMIFPMKINDNLRGTIPHEAIQVAQVLLDRGARVFLVGGCVRDLILGLEPPDIDIATDMPFDDLKEALSSLGRTYELGRKFFTLGLRGNNYNFEISSLRKEKYKKGSRHPEVQPARDIHEDLARRDFTINAVAIELYPDSANIIDPFGGIEDIKSGIIRTPGDPKEKMLEDPLRMMRAVRFASKLGFKIEESLKEIINRNSEALDLISLERRRDELEKIIISPRPDTGIRLLVEMDLMRFIIPEIAKMKGVEQPARYHRADVFEHTLLTMTYVEPDALLRRAALFHDTGKPDTRLTEPKVMFPDHEKIGEEITRRAMTRLKYSRKDIAMTAFLVRKHMRPIRYRSTWKDAAVRRLVRECVLVKGDEVLVPLEKVISLARADILAGSFETVDENLALIDELLERIKSITEKEEPQKIKSPLNGNEIMNLAKLHPGPWIREVKEHLTNLVIEGKLKPEDIEGAKNETLKFLAGKGMIKLNHENDSSESNR